jgi:cytochrome c oxidase subunit II
MRKPITLTALALVLGLAGLAVAQPAEPAPPTDPAAAAAPADPAAATAPAAPADPAAATDPAATAAPADPAAPAAAQPRKKREMPPVPPRTDEEPGTFWMPIDAATQAADVDWLFYGIVALSIFSFIAITVITLYFAWRYRMRPGHAAEHSSSHNDVMEITWTIIPSVILVVIFVVGWKGFLDLNTPPDNAIEIKVTAEKWNWSFQYPNGFVDANLHVPVDRPVRLVMRSKDVLHSLWVPAFRIKQDVIPNRYTKLWFHATQPGVYRLYCTEYCGTGHSQMKHLVQVHPAGTQPGADGKLGTPDDMLSFDAWLEEAEAAMLDMPPAQLGEYIYKNRGCAQCHSVDGSNKTGPPWNGIWGTNRAMADGTSVLVDENYLRESILEPKEKVVAGYPPVMPTFKGQLKDEQIDGLIEYIKTLK